jgi:hypothetical protein
MTTSSIANQCLCSQCGRLLRNAVFCEVCNESLCCWKCYDRHLNQHTRLPSRPAPNQAGRASGSESARGSNATGEN